MNDENAMRVISEFPEIFQVESNSPFKLFGFECGDGWVGLLVDLVKELKEVCGEKTSMRVAQVKEKFGTLRFYVDGWENKVERVIRKAELESAKTCEVCGKTGSINKGPWYEVRCAECKEK